ncbi:hypothetical protein FQZ97_672390 [compost metagenome]
MSALRYAFALAIIVAANTQLANATELTIPSCDVLAELYPSEFETAQHASEDRTILPAFGKSVTTFTSTDFERVKAAYLACAKQTTIWWASDQSPDYIGKRVDEAAASVLANNASAVEADDIHKYVDNVREQVQSTVSGSTNGLTPEQVEKLRQLQREAKQKSEEVSDDNAKWELKSLAGEIDDTISNDAARQANARAEAEFREFARDKSNDGLSPEALALKQRMSGPLMERFTYATAVIAYADYCNAYDNSFADIDLDRVNDRRESAWQAMQIPATAGEQIRKQIELNVKATLSDTWPGECPKNRLTAETILRIIHAD